MRASIPRHLQAVMVCACIFLSSESAAAQTTAAGTGGPNDLDVNTDADTSALFSGDDGVGGVEFNPRKLQRITQKVQRLVLDMGPGIDIPADLPADDLDPGQQTAAPDPTAINGATAGNAAPAGSTGRATLPGLRVGGFTFEGLFVATIEGAQPDAVVVLAFAIIDDEAAKAAEATDAEVSFDGDVSFDSAATFLALPTDAQGVAQVMLPLSFDGNDVLGNNRLQVTVIGPDAAGLPSAHVLVAKHDLNVSSCFDG